MNEPTDNDFLFPVTRVAQLRHAHPFLSDLDCHCLLVHTVTRFDRDYAQLSQESRNKLTDNWCDIACNMDETYIKNQLAYAKEFFL